MTIAITGASGHLGRATAVELFDRLDPSEVALLTREPAKLADLAERGAQVRRGDFDDPASLGEAFVGVERLLLISTDAVGRRVPQHVAAIEAAKAAGVRHVAYTSMGDPSEDNPAFVAGEHRETEEALRASGLEWTFLRNALYADYRLPELRQAIASGRLVHNYGEGASAFVARADCAAAAAAVLATAGHEGKVYDVTGPELLTGEDIAAIASALGGVEVEAVAVDDAAFVAGLVEHAGLPEQLAAGVATFGRAIREGRLAQHTRAVEELAGRPALTLRELATSPAPVS